MLSAPDAADTPVLCSFQDATNKTAPEHRKWRRLHGLQLPLHPQQVAGWVVIVAFAVVAFALLIPVLGADFEGPVFFGLLSLFAIHGVSHGVALLTDPAEDELRKVNSRRVVPEFDRAKHAHVIENGRCHLCNIGTSGPRTKHCSVCNKCVRRFDHHCKWLNHCIGARNYAAFIMCVVSAVGTAAALAALALAEITLFFVNRSSLSPWENPQNQTSGGLARALASNDTAFLIVIGFFGVIAAITAGLLLHLCFFHVYISFLGLTTYEYIRNYRQRVATTAPSAPPPAPERTFYVCSNVKSRSREASAGDRPSGLFCCESSAKFYDHPRDTLYFCSVLEEEKPGDGDYFTSKSYQCCAETRHYGEGVEDRSKTVSRGCTVCTIEAREHHTRVSEIPVEGRHRWRRKWNCCSSTPESPTDPGPTIVSISAENGSALETIGTLSAAVDGRRRHENGSAKGSSRGWSVIRFGNLYKSIGAGKYRKRSSKQHPLRANRVSPLTEIAAEPMKLPSLPPPVRRKIKDITDLQELAESLSDPEKRKKQPREGRSRLRRKRPSTRARSPALSPIKESGLSNPASPQPCRAVLAMALCPAPAVRTNPPQDPPDRR